MRAGLEVEQAPTGVVPSLNTAPEIPLNGNQTTIEPSRPNQQNYPSIEQYRDEGKNLPDIPQE